MKKVFIVLTLVASLINSSNLLAVGTTTEQNHNKVSIKASSSKGDKLFIKEYTYNASEDDSKNSSRKKAIILFG